MKTLPTFLSLVLAAAPLAAQAPASDGTFQASAGLAFAQGDALDLTNKLAGGYLFEVGYQIHPLETGPSVLFFVGYKRLPEGATGPSRTTYSLTGPHVGVELVYRPWESVPLTIATGPAAHVWQINRTNQPGTLGDQGLKIGWRLGVSWLVSRQWSVDLKYTLTEWGGGPDGSGAPVHPGDPAGPVRPAYLSLLGTYHF